MNNSRAMLLRAGGWAALAQGGLAVANPVVVLWMLPARGFRSAQDLADPAKVLALAAPLTALEFFKIASAVAILVIVAALFGRLRSMRSIKLATAAGVVGSALLFAGGAEEGAPAGAARVERLLRRDRHVDLQAIG